jgi:hypothetical protein
MRVRLDVGLFVASCLTDSHSDPHANKMPKKYRRGKVLVGLQDTLGVAEAPVIHDQEQLQQAAIPPLRPEFFKSVRLVSISFYVQRLTSHCASMTGVLATLSVAAPDPRTSRVPNCVLCLSGR